MYYTMLFLNTAKYNNIIIIYFQQRDNDGPLLSIINNKKTQLSNTMPYLWLSYENNIEMWRNSGKFWLVLFNKEIKQKNHILYIFK